MNDQSVRFAKYRESQLKNLGWSGRPDFPPSATLAAWVAPACEPSQVAIEIGCCDGKFLHGLWLKGYRVIGLDLFHELVMKIPVTEAHHLIVGDVHDLPLASAMADVILFDNGLEHSWNLCWAMYEIARVLKRPGSFYTAAPLQAKALSSCHLWEVSTVEAMVTALHCHVPEAQLVRCQEMNYPPEHQVLMHFQWN